MTKQKYIKYLIIPSFALIVAVSIFVGDVFADVGGGLYGSEMGTSGGGGSAITAPSGTGLPTGTIEGVIGKIIKFFLGFVGGLSVLVIVVAGVMYIASGGDEGKTKTAKNILMYAIVGLVVSLLAWIIVNVVIKTI